MFFKPFHITYYAHESEIISILGVPGSAPKPAGRLREGAVPHCPLGQQSPWS